MDRKEPDLDCFEKLAVIGRGTYAKVILIKRKGVEGKYYAMKVLKKKYIKKKKQENHVMIERNILATIQHPFIVKLYHSFQDKKKLYFVLEYCAGGELYRLLTYQRRFTEQQAKFYAAQIILAIEYLHKKDIVYRDLKPENILIDSYGYIKLTDFGLSKMNISQNNQLSICGTPQYLAPEILHKSGHGKPVDWWCLAAIIYEMVIGLPPFFCKSANELFRRIKNQNPSIPLYLTSKLRNLLQQLFMKDPQERLGSEKGAEQIKSHPWFEMTDWTGILNKTVKPPHLPQITSERDLRNFASQFTESKIDSGCEASQKSDEEQGYEGFSFHNSPSDEKMEQQLQMEGDFSMNIETNHENQTNF